MAKKKKIIFFIIIIIICAGGLIINNNNNSEDDVYVLSEDSNKSNNLQVINENKDVKDNEQTNISAKEVTVYVSGAVNNPGVVTLNQGDRLSDAVEKVGGTTENVDFNQINLAIRVEDEKHYIIPKIGEKIENQDEQIVQTDNNDNNQESSSKININSATIEELDTLPGVGEATANKIVNYRSESGKFKSIEEIKNVNGIGDKKYEDLKDLISVE